MKNFQSLVVFHFSPKTSRTPRIRILCKKLEDNIQSFRFFLYRIDCPLGRKPGGSTRAEEKPLRDTVCRLRGKGLDLPCDSYWGWLSWFYRHSVISFLSKIGITGRSLKVASNRLRPQRNMHQVGFGWKREVFRMKEIHAEPPFPCDYVRNGDRK